MRRVRTRRRDLVAVLLGLLILAPVWALAEAKPAPVPSRVPTEGAEVLQYRWHLGGFLGFLAGFVLPNDGEGRLVTRKEANGRVASELLITSQESAQGEFWSYGAEIDPQNLDTVRAWSASRWQGKSRKHESEVKEKGVVDIASAIYRLRRDRPETPKQMTIWSDGRLYPVLVIPRELSRRRVGDRVVAVRHYQIQGFEKPGQRFWEGRLGLWLAQNPAATPVEIAVERSLANLHLVLTKLPASDAEKVPGGSAPY